MKKLTNEDKKFLIKLLKSELYSYENWVYDRHREYYQEVTLNEVKINKRIEKEDEKAIKEGKKYINSLIEKIEGGE